VLYVANLVVEQYNLKPFDISNIAESFLPQLKFDSYIQLLKSGVEVVRKLIQIIEIDSVYLYGF